MTRTTQTTETETTQLRATILNELQRAITALEKGNVTAYARAKARSEKASAQLAELED